MPSYNLTREMMEPQEFTHLVGVPRRQNYLVAVFSQLFNDRNKEGNMWGIVKIDPDSSLCLHPQAAIDLAIISIIKAFKKLLN